MYTRIVTIVSICGSACQEPTIGQNSATISSTATVLEPIQVASNSSPPVPATDNVEVFHMLDLVVALPEQCAAAVVVLSDLPIQKRNDSWGTPYRIECQGSKWALRSAGGDRIFGTVDDHVVSSNEKRVPEH